MNHYLHSDITMVFLPGTHYLNVSFSLSYLHSLTMKSKSTAAQIVCMGRSHMTFRRFQNVQIANLEFTGCAGNHIEDTERFELVNTIFKQGGTALELIDTMAAKILNSTFISNNAARGALFSQRSKIEIEASMFYNNTASGVSFGGVLSSYGSTVTLTTSEFDQSSASYGGAIYVLFSNLTIEACTFQNNSAKSHGSVLYTDLSNVTIDASEFDGNGALSGNLLFYNSNVTIKKSHHIKGRATYGAGLYSHQSDVRIEASYFANNIAANEGGGLYSLRSNIMIKGTKFIHNRAISCGAALYSYRSNITLKTSKAENNTAHVGVGCSTSSNIKIEASVLDNNMGGVMRSSDGNISIKTSQFHKNIGGVLTMRSRESISIAASEFIENSATEYGGDGGVLVCTLCSNISITGCKFSKNTAIQKGGALYFHLSNVRMGDCDFTNNNSTTGSAFYAIYSSIVVQHGSFLVANNTARKDATIYLITSNFLSKNSTLLFSHNLGSLMAFKSNVTFTSHNVLFVNSQPQISIQEGGAMTLLQSNAFFNDFCRLERNHAENGGAILSIDSKIFVKGDVSIAQNKVSESGGGVYLLNSELNLQEHSKFVLFNNTAAHRGGGLHAISSSIESISAYSDPYYTGAQLIFTRNKAD